jgi:integration host factor subunit beta
MTRSDLVTQLCGLYPQVESRLIEDAISLFFFEIASALQQNARVELRGFGSFCLRKRRERLGRNPKTGKRVAVQAKWLPFFKGGKELKEAANQKHYRPQLFQLDLN